LGVPPPTKNADRAASVPEKENQKHVSKTLLVMRRAKIKKTATVRRPFATFT